MNEGIEWCCSIFRRTTELKIMERSTAKYYFKISSAGHNLLGLFKGHAFNRNSDQASLSPRSSWLDCDDKTTGTQDNSPE